MPHSTDADRTSLADEAVAVEALGPPGTARDASVDALLQRHGLRLVRIADDHPIPASYWGEPEAGLRDARLYARADTPLHSILHELSHAICMSDVRRHTLDTDAGGDDAEECAVCYLSIVLAEDVAGFGSARMLADMDIWGYSFRLGNARAWFEDDAADARAWLQARRLIASGHDGRCATAADTGPARTSRGSRSRKQFHSNS